MRLRADTFTALIALGISAFILLQGRDLGLGRPNDPGSGFILFWTGIIMTGLSAVLLVQSLRARAEDSSGLGDAFAGLRWGKVLYVMALMLLYAAVVEYFGFILSTAVLLLVLFKTVEPQSWRVAILGSGGMTHFVVDEPFDRRFLAAFMQEDSKDLFALPENLFHSGNSELKNWVPVRAAMQYAGLPFTLLDYQPLYRSMAGTGSGMGFGYWM